jgi:hypothetical protein
METDGSSGEENGLAKVKFDRERVRLPIHVVESARHPSFASSAAIKCWLLVVTPGRYRLVMQPSGPPTGHVAKILQEIQEAEEFGDVLDRTDDNARDAIGERLIPCTVSFTSRIGWRVNFPKAAKDLVPQKEERSFVYVRLVAGYVEIWFPDTLRRALYSPLSEILI